MRPPLGEGPTGRPDLKLPWTPVGGTGLYGPRRLFPPDPVGKFRVDTWLEEDGVRAMDEDLAHLLRRLGEGASLRQALDGSPLTARDVRTWRSAVQRVLGADPLTRAGRRLTVSETGRALREEFLRKNTSTRIFLTQGLRVPLLAVDGLVLVEGRLVVIKRKYEPYVDRPCLPGGMVEHGEPVEAAAVREIREETGLDTRVQGLVGVYSDPDRDPRGHVISLAFALEHVGGDLLSGTDAAEVGLLDLEELPEMGFDHNAIVADYLRWRQGRSG